MFICYDIQFFSRVCLWEMFFCDYCQTPVDGCFYFVTFLSNKLLNKLSCSFKFSIRV